MRSLLLCAAALLVPVAAFAEEGPAGAAPIELELRRMVGARLGPVLLGDVAKIWTTDLAAIRRLVTLPIGQAPRAGAEASVQRRDLDRWIRQRLGIASHRLVWRGPDESLVRTDAIEVAAGTIEAVARGALERQMGAAPSRLRSAESAVGHGLVVPQGRVDFRARPALAVAGSSRALVWVDVIVDERLVRTVSVNFDIEPRAADAAAQGLEQGVSLGSMRHIPAAQAVAKPEAMAGNAPTESLVARGQWVTMRYRSGGIELLGRAQVMDAGALGQTVRVKSSQGTQAVSARVVAADTVEALQ